MDHGARVRRADEGDRETVVRLLDAAFAHDPVSHWVFPDPQRRRTRHPLLVGAFTDIVLADGHVDLRADGTAAALWLPMPDRPETTTADGGDREDEVDGPALLRAAVDPDNERVELIGRLTEGIHPPRAHTYLWMIGVDPAHQGRGRGAALMRPVLDRCDRDGLPAYLEASSPRSRELYRRLGFTVREPVLRLPYGGPVMWPMWRDPVSP
ncbi:GNAT family N-acetyltransferase [Streptomyces yaizuensis]|uniref:GNAT family N-acetyltransferase n=1 Tax=Streptomyces yaizuensis TaxID=2989713 RepID=A0ABQ5P2R8_9ACTN|nr:GNAT family N-acetyltransferase [Streptomyces sp. YSPA8]GLF96896.1 GNAT family N-acetyltransferase [Streptomyces sp. YSPA8]